MNLFDLLLTDGVNLKKVASTHGGEWQGPCPFCGGTDRFHVWPELKGGRFWCRKENCNKSGDAVQYLRDAKGFSYRDACEHMRIDAKTYEALAMPMRRERTGFSPREATAPPPLWQEKATAFFQATQQTLQMEPGSEARAFLYNRGLSDFSIKCLGWNKAERYLNREAWGLPTERRKDGRPRRLWLPKGLLIALWENHKVTRLRIRRSDPGAGPRYVIVSGSSMRPMTWGQDKRAAVVVESELDGLLLTQEVSDIATVIALGSSQIKPDRITHEILMKAEMILVALDSDEAGALASKHFWSKTYGTKAKRWPVPIGKDPSEAYQEGVDVASWITAGIDIDIFQEVK